MDSRQPRESEQAFKNIFIEILNLNNIIWHGSFPTDEVIEEIDFIIQRLNKLKEIYKNERRKQ